MNKVYSVIPWGRKKKLIILDSPRRAVLYFSTYSIDLLSNRKKKESINFYLDTLDQKVVQKNQKFIEIHHLFYELSELLIFKNQDCCSDTPLAIEIVYQDVSPYRLDTEIKSVINPNVKRSISYKNYEDNFLLGQEELYKGNTYQFNYTHQFSYETKSKKPKDFINKFFSKRDKVGQFAHATYIEAIDKLILSNSPESLFQWKGYSEYSECVSSPIKGTAKLRRDLPIQSQWANLQADEKNQAELFMIIDLLRNDLNSISRPVSKIVRKKAMLKVPGLLHQMGIIKVKLPPDISVGRMVRSLFPGGSITGAPKKRTLAILKSIESHDRGIYTGSTMIIHSGQVDCSINIRTAMVDFENEVMKYGAGGGVTLRSNSNDEYHEMLDKVDSFINTFFKS